LETEYFDASYSHSDCGIFKFVEFRRHDVFFYLFTASQMSMCMMDVLYYSTEMVMHTWKSKSCSFLVFSTGPQSPLIV
jgi:hypothetical protein